VNPFEFVIAVLFLVFAFAIIRHKLGMRDPLRQIMGGGEGETNNAENAQLRNQVQQLQDRIRVLERIVTDRGVETAAQIEALRDRDAIENEDKVQ
jgi:hypothetical protein